MRIQLFFFVLLMLAFSNTIAQTSDTPAKINWGAEYNEPNNSFISKVLPGGDYFYAIRRKTTSGLSTKSKVFIEQFDQNMSLLKSQEITLEYKGKPLDYENMIILNGNLFLLSSFHNKAKKRNYLFSQGINMRTLKAGKSLKKIGEIETKTINKGGSFGVNVSRDSSKVLLFSALPSKRNKPERFALRVFNDGFEELWDRNITLPYDSNEFSLEEFRVDNEGNVYLLGIQYGENGRAKRRGKPNYQYLVLAYTANGDDAEKYQINLKEKFITDLTFRIASDGHLVCSGFFSERGNTSIKGTYFFRIDPVSKEIYNKNLKEFDLDFLTTFMSEKRKRKAEKAEREGDVRNQIELFSYSLDRLVLRSDGGALLIAEQYYIERDRNDFYDPYGYGGFYGSRYGNRNNNSALYNYNDIIVVNIQPTGEIEWTARIPKRQETRDDGGYYSSYAMAIVKDRIYFVYNDNGRNFDPDRRKNRIHYFNGRNSIIALAEVMRDGSVNTYPLFSNREAGTVTRPKICKQTGRHQMIIYGERGRQYRFANLEFLN